ncbi:MAG: hypothetical protein Q8P32_02440 [Candidatus Komeilibacteria bacterium]|nr:hypothetical protein [Candidatus Komeilibacteria bacterium]
MPEQPDKNNIVEPKPNNKGNKPKVDMKDLEVVGDLNSAEKIDKRSPELKSVISQIEEIIKNLGNNKQKFNELIESFEMQKKGLEAVETMPQANQQLLDQTFIREFQSLLAGFNKKLGKKQKPPAPQPPAKNPDNANLTPDQLETADWLLSSTPKNEKERRFLDLAQQIALFIKNESQPLVNKLKKEETNSFGITGSAMLEQLAINLQNKILHQHKVGQYDVESFDDIVGLDELFNILKERVDAYKITKEEKTEPVDAKQQAAQKIIEKFEKLAVIPMTKALDQLKLLISGLSEDKDRQDTLIHFIDLQFSQFRTIEKEIQESYKSQQDTSSFNLDYLTECYNEAKKLLKSVKDEVAKQNKLSSLVSVQKTAPLGDTPEQLSEKTTEEKYQELAEWAKKMPLRLSALKSGYGFEPLISKFYDISSQFNVVNTFKNLKNLRDSAEYNDQVNSAYDSFKIFNEELIAAEKEFSTQKPLKIGDLIQRQYNGKDKLKEPLAIQEVFDFNGQLMIRVLEDGKRQVMPYFEARLVELAPEPLTPPLTKAGQKDLASHAKKYLAEQFGYFDIEPEKIFGSLTEAEVGQFTELLRTGDKSGMVDFCKSAINKLLISESREKELSDEMAQKIAEELEKLITQTIELQAISEANKLNLKKAGNLGMAMVKNYAVIAGTIAAVGALGFSTAGIGAVGAITVASLGLRRWLEHKKKKGQPQAEEKYKQDLKRAKEEVLGRFANDVNLKAKLSGIIANQLREQTGGVALAQVKNFAPAELETEEKETAQKLDLRQQKIFESVLSYVRLNNPDASSEQIQSMAVVMAMTLGMHETTDRDAADKLAKIKADKDGAIELIKKFNQARFGAKPKDVDDNVWQAIGRDALAVGLGTGVGMAIRTNEYARVLMGAVAGATFGHAIGGWLDKKAEEKGMLAIDGMITSSESKIKDLELHSDQVNALSQNATFVASKLEMGLLDKNPVLLNRAKNFIYNVRQLELKNQTALDQLLNLQKKNNNALAGQLKGDLKVLEKSVKYKRRWGAAFGAILGAVGAEAAFHYFGNNNGKSGELEGTTDGQSDLNKYSGGSLEQLRRHDIDYDIVNNNIDVKRPMSVLTFDIGSVPYDYTDKTVTFKGSIISQDEFFKVHPYAGIIQEKEIIFPGFMGQDDLTPDGKPIDQNVVPVVAKQPAGSIEPTTVMVEGKSVALTTEIKAQLKTGDTIVDYGEVDKNKSVSEALNKAMAPNATVTVINPDGKVLLTANGQPVKFYANLAHEGDQVFEVKHADGSKEIFVQKAGVTVKEGQSLQGRYDEIAAKFKLDQIPPDFKDKFNTDKDQGGFHQRLNYQEAQAARNAWDADHSSATAGSQVSGAPSSQGQPIFDNSHQGAPLAKQDPAPAPKTEPDNLDLVGTANGQKIIPATEVTPNLLPSPQRDLIDNSLSHGNKAKLLADLIAGHDLELGNGDYLQAIDYTSDTDDVADGFLVKTSDNTIIYEAKFSQNPTNDEFGKLLAQAKTASNNLQSIADHLGTNRLEAAKFFAEYKTSTSVPELTDFKPGDGNYQMLDNFVKKLGQDNLDLLKDARGGYSLTRIGFASEMMHRGWRPEEIKNIFEKMPGYQEQSLFHRLIDDKKYSASARQILDGLAMAEKLNLNSTRELAFAQLAADATKDYGPEKAIEYAQRIFGQNDQKFTATRITYNETNQIHIEGLSDGTSTVQKCILDVKAKTIIIVTGDKFKEYELVDDDDLNSISQYLKTEAPVDQGAGAETGQKGGADGSNPDVGQQKVVALSDGSLSRFYKNDQGEVTGFEAAEVQHGGTGREYLIAGYEQNLAANLNIKDQQLALNKISESNGLLVVLLETYEIIKNNQDFAKEAEFLKAEIISTMDDSERKFNAGIYNRSAVNDVLVGNHAPLKPGEKWLENAPKTDVPPTSGESQPAEESGRNLIKPMQDAPRPFKAEQYFTKGTGTDKINFLLSQIKGNKEVFNTPDGKEIHLLKETNKGPWFKVRERGDTRMEMIDEGPLTESNLEKFERAAGLSKQPDGAAVKEIGVVLPKNYEIAQTAESMVGKPYDIDPQAGLDCMTLISDAANKNLGQYKVLDDYVEYLSKNRDNSNKITFSQFFAEQNPIFKHDNWDMVRPQLKPGQYLIALESPAGPTHGPEGHGGILTVTTEGQFILHHASSSAILPVGSTEPVSLHQLTLKIDGKEYSGYDIVEKFADEYKKDRSEAEDGAKIYSAELMKRLHFYKDGQEIIPQLQPDGALRMGYVVRDLDLASYFTFNPNFSKDVSILPLLKKPSVLANAA